MNNFAVGIKLETKLVGSIQGDFYIPSYQRGYRWGKDEVSRLLDDIYSNGNNNYCLQPVVVKRDNNRFELIDGQQRLTTLFILLQYIKKEFKPRIDLKYSLTYETRLNSATFLQNIDSDQADENIDFFYIAQAYQTIDEWFRKQPNDVVAADDVYGSLVKHVKIIWYEVGEDEDAIGLFTRLNIGKIPLTSAELVKAMFLSRDNSKTMTREKQEEIALQWDNIEKELHNSSFWGFLSDKDYQTRIDLILNLIANKPSNNKDKYFTFFYFDVLRSDLDSIWKKIQHTFLILKDWYEDHNLYHKIGYLIASKDANWTLQKIFSASVGKTKTDFAKLLDGAIAETIKLKNSNYADLDYNKAYDYARISRLLLLYNVETVRIIEGQSQRFPFDQFKSTKGGAWSLEHIHAQQSQGMQKQEQWKMWLELHIPSVLSLQIDSADLVARMKDAIAKEKLERTEFEDIQEEVVALLSAEGNMEFLHSIANLALLRTRNNAALNNSTFDVKRNEIIRMDKEGEYIPFCTRMVFLKYYTPSADNQLHFWGQADRVAYVNDINRVLEKYLGSNLILLEKEAE
ncbi:MAG: DUF262 domain-containing protein [Clostridia bacterium]|nr:DUF262 domain-containing protein [Clostridia bacterium]MBQ8739751.1 DUF262 domain-containing protein [Clostridia bacterium]